MSNKIKEEKKVFSISFLKTESKHLSELQKIALKSESYVNISEIIRSGVYALLSLPDEEILNIWKVMPRFQRGRPAKKKSDLETHGEHNWD